MIHTTGLSDFSAVIDYFFQVLNQFVNLMFSNWIFVFLIILFIFSVVFDLILILKGKK